MSNQPLFGGISKVEMPEPEFALGHGIFIRKTYAHLFAPFTMAFKPPGKYGFHDGPWKTTKGGYSFDILTEIEMPTIPDLADTFNQEELIWIIAGLVRIRAFPFIIVPAIADMSFNNILVNKAEPSIYPFETQHRIFAPAENNKPKLDTDTLNWIKEHWYTTAMLLKNQPKFYAAFKAFDEATIRGKISLSLLTIWGAIEQLFSPSTGELKYRVSANLAAYLTPHGEERLRLFKELSKLYNDRSTAAHTSKELDDSPLINSYVHLRNAILKIVETGKVPNQDDLEKLQFTLNK